MPPHPEESIRLNEEVDLKRFYACIILVSVVTKYLRLGFIKKDILLIAVEVQGHGVGFCLALVKTLCHMESQWWEYI